MFQACPTCGYRSATTDARCPQCGADLTDPRHDRSDSYKASWLWGIVAAVLAFCAILWLWLL